MDWGSTLLVLLTATWHLSLTSAQQNDEARVIADIFRNYSVDARPMWVYGVPVTVTCDFFPIQLMEVNEKDQTFSMYGLFLFLWYDPYLQWDPRLYGGQQMITVDHSKHWNPALGVFNSVEKFYDPANANGFRTRIQYFGWVEKQIGGEFKVTCKMVIRNFPFDTQTCVVRLASTSMDTRIITLTPRAPGEPMLTDLYAENGQWVLSNTSIKNILIRPAAANGGSNYSGLDFTFQLRRKNTYHMLNIIAPMVMIILLVPALFMIPPDAGEKLGLGVTILLALSVFLLTIGEVTPATSDYVPILTEFVTFQMAITCTSIMCSVLVLRMHHCTSAKRPPRVVRNLFLGYMAKALCLGDLRKEVNEVKELTWASKSPNVKDSLANLKDQAQKDEQFLSMSPGNAKLLQYLDVLVQKVKDDEDANEVLEEWKAVGVVIDRLLFWLFSLVILIVSICIFVGANMGNQHGLYTEAIS